MRPVCAAPLAAIASAALAACDPRASEPPPAPRSDAPALTKAEQRAIVGLPDGDAATLRTGPNVPLGLPRGISLYPGARVISSTLIERGIERGGARGILLVFETTDPIEKVMLHYRGEARAAGVLLTLDLGGADRASLGGTMRAGGELAIAAWRVPAGTRVELSASRG